MVNPAITVSRPIALILLVAASFPAEPEAVGLDEASSELVLILAFLLVPVYALVLTPVPLVQGPGCAEEENVMSAHCHELTCQTTQQLTLYKPPCGSPLVMTCSVAFWPSLTSMPEGMVYY